MKAARPVVEVFNLGLRSYQAAVRQQQVCVERLRSGSRPALLLCEHRPVYTTGLRGGAYPDTELHRLRLLGADVERSNRGGLITFHGPGQIVVYPVLDLTRFRKSIRWYVSQLEFTIIALCRKFGVNATTCEHTGVWVGERKICAIGVHCSRYITSHGVALNCNTDLSWFSHIVPCGVVGKGVTSLSAELSRDVGVAEVVPHLLTSFSEVFDCQLTNGSAELWGEGGDTPVGAELTSQTPLSTNENK